MMYCLFNIIRGSGGGGGGGGGGLKLQGCDPHKFNKNTTTAYHKMK
jgi:hypothetical protein